MIENHNARVLALQTLYSQSVGSVIRSNVSPLDFVDLNEINVFQATNKKLFDKIINGVTAKNKTLEAEVQKFAHERPIKDINIVDLLVLKIAIWEGFLEKITPPKVAINEAIELAKKFGGKNSSKFVSGVLGKLYECLEKENNG